MKAGILGMPLSGKTTLWCLLTESIEGPDPAALGRLQLKVVKVRDRRLERLRDDYTPKKYTPATIELADFPSLAREPQDRAGLADLLAPARTMDVLVVVLRGFESAAVPPHGGSVDPLRDWREIAGELLLTDQVIVEKRIEKLEGQVKKATPTQEQDRKELALLQRVCEHLDRGSDLARFPFTSAERKQIQGFQFLSLKPKIAVLNRGEEAPQAAILDVLATEIGAPPFVAAVKNELEILQLPPEDQDLFRAELGVLPGTRDEVLRRCYESAGLISFFTAGEKEVRAWTIRDGDAAVTAAAEIHSDIARGFIRAETVGFEDYVADGGLKGAREKGHFRLEGKEYAVRDGDIIEFRFSV